MKPSKPLRVKRLVTGPDDFGSVYVYYANPRKKVAQTVKHNAEVGLDYDEHGNLCGIEILAVNPFWKERPKK